MTGARLVIGPDRSDCTVVLAGDRIEAVTRGSAPPDAPRLDCTDADIEPGVVNSHTHLYGGLSPLGMPPPARPPSNFLEKLERVWWRLDRALDEASLRAAVRYYAADALTSGTTSLIDHNESPGFLEGSLDVIAQACAELGIRIATCYGATERNGGFEEAERGLEECRRFSARARGGDSRGLVGLHASFTVSDQAIERAGELCRELETPLHIHLAEDAVDVVDARRRGHAGPLERLMSLGALSNGAILAHGVHLDDEQVKLASDQGCWFVQNPRSNRGNRVGHAMALGAASRVALGTDGFPACMADEAAALLEERAAWGVSDAAEPSELVRAGARLASELFGVPLGEVTVGSGADLVVRDQAGVRHVVVAGRIVLRDGALTGADREEIIHTARSEASLLWCRQQSPGEQE